MIDIKGVTKQYGTGEASFQALKGVSAQINAGEFISIYGPSGCGKSTLMHLMGGLDRPTEGSVAINEQALSVLTDKELAYFRNKTIGFVFQFFYLIPYMSALSNAVVPLIYDKQSGNRKERAIKILTELGLEKKLKNKPSQLSGGERQRVAMARALINDPDIILADEPTGNLDTKTGQQAVTLLRSFHERGKTLVVVTHDDKLAEQADRVIYMKDGQIV